MGQLRTVDLFILDVIDMEDGAASPATIARVLRTHPGSRGRQFYGVEEGLARGLADGAVELMEHDDPNGEFLAGDYVLTQ